MVERTLAHWLIERHAAKSAQDLWHWVKDLESFGKTYAVRAAVVAARAALPAWERVEPNERAPHERIAAVEAWLACPCDAHADAAGDLAFANGDDNAIKGWSSIRIEGREVDDPKATYAHWSADSACSAAWVKDDHFSAQAAATAFGQALEALEDDGPLPLRGPRLADAVADAFVPLATHRAKDAPPLPPSQSPTVIEYPGPPLSNVRAFATFAQRVLGVLGAHVDAVPVFAGSEREDGARLNVYRFESRTGRIDIRVAPGPRWSAFIERVNGPSVEVTARGEGGEGGDLVVHGEPDEARRIAGAVLALTSSG
jgi:hypothetical protein